MKENKFLLTAEEAAGLLNDFRSLKAQGKPTGMWRTRLSREMAEAVEEIYKEAFEAGQERERQLLVFDRKEMEDTRAAYLSHLRELRESAKKTAWAIESAENDLRNARLAAESVADSPALD